MAENAKQESVSVELTNTGKGPRGGFDAEGRPFTLRPGETATLKLAKNHAERLRRRAERGGDVKLRGDLSKDDKERVDYLRAGQDPDEARRQAEAAAQIEEQRKAQEASEAAARKEAEKQENERRKAEKGK